MSWLAGALWVISSAVVLATVIALMLVVLAVLEARDRRREWAGIRQLDEARRATGPRSLP